MKIETQFKQWEGRVFGAGYGTGEMPILKALIVFFESLDDRSYNFEVLESKLGDTVTWLLINALYKGNQIEWGTSARFGWLTSCGENVKSFVTGKTSEQLYDILMSDDDNDYCECDGQMKEKGHEFCGKNPMVNEKYADQLKYGK